MASFLSRLSTRTVLLASTLGALTPFGLADEPTPVQKLRPAANIDAARRQAELLHTTIDSALRVTHDRYFREDSLTPIPAGVLREVFRDLEKKQGVRLQWLAVEGQAMNTDHQAKTVVEKAAVTALKQGKPFFEQTGKERLLRVMPIKLTNHCLKCHVPDRRSLEDRTAGLLIEIAVAAGNEGH